MFHNHPYLTTLGVVAGVYVASFVAIYVTLGVFMVDTSSDPELVSR